MQRGVNRSVSNMFGGAQAAQLQAQIHERDEEIVELKQQLEALRLSPEESDGVRRYPIEQFVPLRLPDGLTQPRKYFDPNGMEKLKLSIQKVGVQEPLLARRGSDGRLEIVSGERRWRSAKDLQLIELPAILKELDDEQALEIALIANLMREDLNPVEETDSIVALVALRLKVNHEQLPSILFKIKNLRSRYKKSDQQILQDLQEENAENSGILTETAIKDIDSILAEFGLGLESFVANRLVALQKMPELLLEAVRKGDIGLSKADVIRKSELPLDDQEKILEKAINDGLTKQDISKQVQALKYSPTEVSVKRPSTEQVDLKTQVHQRYQNVRQKKIWKRIESSPKLKKKMERVNALLSELLASVAEEG